MIELSFVIQFHGPFRVGTGRGRDGVHAAIDIDDPIPASHLKGLMRASVRDVIGLTEPDLNTVFGARRDRGTSPWAWDSGYPTHGSWRDVLLRNTVRIAINDETGTAQPDQLRVGEQLWPAPDFRARFTVTLAGAVPVGELPWHEAVLRLAARSTTELGGQRRRGQGWITVRPEDSDSRELAAADLRLVMGQEVA